MPYIPDIRRHRLDAGTDVPGNPGELTYILFREAKHYLDERGVSFYHLSHVLGALEATKLEIYRKIGAPYENRKEAENGPVR